MQFGVLIFINIILWALFYLVISLKLERSAAEFREKRFRREMDEVIREFNETAERNISILENRIAIMKKMLANTGALRSVDISLMDEIESPADAEGKAPGPFRSKAESPGTLENEHVMPQSAPRQERRADNTTVGEEPGLAYHATMLIRTLSDKAVKIRNIALEYVYARLTRDQRAAADADRQARKSALQSEDFVNTGDHAHLIERELRDMKSMSPSPGGEHDFDDPGLSEDELMDMFHGSGDKYGLAAELYRKGYPVDVLARCSSIPLGEIKLVLNLNKSL
jgi:hypothetical protein